MFVDYSFPGLVFFISVKQFWVASEKKLSETRHIGPFKSLADLLTRLWAKVTVIKLKMRQSSVCFSNHELNHGHKCLLDLRMCLRHIFDAKQAKLGASVSQPIEYALIDCDSTAFMRVELPPVLKVDIVKTVSVSCRNQGCLANELIECFYGACTMTEDDFLNL